MTYILNQAKFDKWLSRSPLFKGAPAGHYSLIDGRSLHHRKEPADERRGIQRYIFTLSGSRRLFGNQRGDSGSHIALQFEYERGTRVEGSTDLLRPSASVLIEESASFEVPASPDDRRSQAPRLEMDGDTPRRLIESRDDRVLLDAVLRAILEGVRECMEPK